MARLKGPPIWIVWLVGFAAPGLAWLLLTHLTCMQWIIRFPVTERVDLELHAGPFLAVMAAAAALSGMLWVPLMELIDFAFALKRIDPTSIAAFAPPMIVGWVELVLYSLAIASCRAEFIPAWLLIKVAGNYKLWHDASGRSRFQRFLIGSGISILVAVVAASHALGTGAIRSRSSSLNAEPPGLRSPSSPLLPASPNR